MQFTTQIQIPAGKKPIDYNSRVLSVGSCFATEMSQKFQYFKFQNLENPFGVLFHALAIENLIIRALNNQFYVAEELVFNNEQWHCLDAHSQLSSSQPDELLKTLNGNLTATKDFLLYASHIILTLGTAWVYQYQETGNTVANCHKIPAKAFRKSLLSVNDVAGSLQKVLVQLRAINKEVQVILTVSPVRHLKDGFAQNTLSKSVLIQAVHQICETNPEVDYFPSYELMMDELRDYRFYKSDMIHPNSVAIDYIWERFSNSWIHPSSKILMNRIDKVQKSMQHRPFNKNSQAYQSFLSDLKKEQDAIKQLYSHITF